MLTVGGLFSGIGGWELGLQRAGMHIAWHCESDAFCQRVLKAHWPDIPCFDDVRELTGVAPVDVLCGGFPCQDISVAGAGAGIGGSRSGLWGEFARLIGELRPRYVLVENVAALTYRGLDVVLADLAALGFDAEWDCLSAAAFGAPHRRDRLWLVAYPQRPGLEERLPDSGQAQVSESGNGRLLAHADSQRRDGWPGEFGSRGGPESQNGCDPGTDKGRSVVNASSGRHGSPQGEVRPRWDGSVSAGWWATEPDVGRLAHGIPQRVDQLRALGNALVPQVAEWIGRRIVQFEADHL